MKSPLSLVMFVGLVGGAAACSHAQTVHPVEAAQPAAPTQQVASTPAATTTTPTAVSPNVSVSGDLARRCHLKGDETQEAPKFGYDAFQLLPADRSVLQSIASCLTTGPLAGHAVKLVGRADPRGTEEYNLGLGTRRAGTVEQYLERLGVNHQKLAADTRGAEDATGQDENGWKVDRRVDLELND